ncbi:cation-transporting P-type ATPase [Rhodoferax sp.]|uniref:P-type ATPase n=1 Tax=Rhodoferax sp. TaxID=50421 RepID=UPI002ACD9F28|nr:cation-transporting P-type ATPase [Rhodoferax sp.]MDZ7922367.1 cation-transporting P-type ATPase [Rhodoferax sp.]
MPISSKNTPTGLSQTEAAQRLRADGPNVLPGEQPRRLAAIVRDTLKEPMFMLLLAAAVLYGVLGDWQEGGILMGLVLVVLGLTLYQEGKTERAMQALRQLSSPRALVLRDGQQQRIAGRDVVVGDLLVVAEGDRIAADAVLLDGSEVTADESLLTGESTPVDKQAVPADGDTPTTLPPQAGGNQTPFLYCGTLVVKGHGTARVLATGERTAMGRIGSALQSLQAEASPLRAQTARLVRTLAVVAFSASASLVLAYGLLRGDWMDAVLAGIALAMALLPQEFTVVLTVLPALGAWRLSKLQVLTRRIAAIETLGATSVLCVDKTGTLTENRMTVAQLYAYGGAQADATLAVDYSAQSAAAGGLSHRGRIRHPGQRARPLRPDGAGVSPPGRALPARHRTPAPRLDPGARIRPDATAARHVPCVDDSNPGPHAHRGGQGRARSGGGSVPPARGRAPAHCRRRGRHGGSRPAGAGGGTRPV